MLDSAASEGTELTSIALESEFRRYLKGTEKLKPSSGLLRFSPGYCGWHISAQKYLFDFLRPEEIGLRLRETFLMEPLKSISGVMVAGPKEIFEFDDTFSFCLDCMTHTCRERIQALRESLKPE